jgi:hypothetical protein
LNKGQLDGFPLPESGDDPARKSRLRKPLNLAGISDQIDLIADGKTFADLERQARSRRLNWADYSQISHEVPSDNRDVEMFGTIWERDSDSVERPHNMGIRDNQTAVDQKPASRRNVGTDECHRRRNASEDFGGC